MALRPWETSDQRKEWADKGVGRRAKAGRAGTTKKGKPSREVV